jgi:hypothetical protein
MFHVEHGSIVNKMCIENIDYKYVNINKSVYLYTN